MTQKILRYRSFELVVETFSASVVAHVRRYVTKDIVGDKVIAFTFDEAVAKAKAMADRIIDEPYWPS